MALTLTQQQALAAHIATVPEWAALPKDSDSAVIIAAGLNQTAAPAFIVWRTRVSQDEIMQNGFDWVRVDNLSVGKARIWDWLFSNSVRAINPSKVNVRAGIAECWKGTAADLAVQAAVLAHCKREATIVERVLATGTGSDAAPATMSFEGAIGYADVQAARGE